MKLLKYVLLLEREAAEAKKVADTVGKLDNLRLPGPSGLRRAARPRRDDETDDQRMAYLKDFVGEPGDTRALPGDCQEYIMLCLNKMEKKSKEVA